MLRYDDLVIIVTNVDNDDEFKKALNNATNYNHSLGFYEKKEFLALCDISSIRVFEALCETFSKEQVNQVLFKLFNMIDYSEISSSDKNLRSNLLDNLIHLISCDFLNIENRKIIESKVFNNINFYIYADRFIVSNSSYNKQEESLNYINIKSNILLFKHYLGILLYYPDRYFIRFIKDSSLDFFKQVSCEIFKGTLYKDELNNHSNDYLEDTNVETIMHKYDEKYKGKKASKCIFELCLYESYLFYSLLDLCKMDDEDNILKKIQFLIENDFVDISVILENWKSLPENLTLFSNINQSIDKYQSHPFLKLVKKGYHQIALYFLNKGYTLSEEENSYILNSSKKNKEIYKDHTFKLKDGFYNEFKHNIDKCDSSRNSLKKIESIFEDKEKKERILEILHKEDEISFKKITPELVNISKSEISKYNFLSTVDILIISMNTVAVEILFKNNYPFNIKQMLLFCRFSRKHYDKYRGVISYLSNFLLNRQEHYNYFMSHNLNIAREDGLQINEKYVRELTGNYNFDLEKGLGLSAINKLSHHLRFKETKYEYYKDALNLNLYSYFLDQDYKEIDTYYDISLISFLVLQKADDGYDVSNLFNVLDSHNALKEIDHIVKMIKEEKKLTDPMIHFLSLHDKKLINNIIDDDKTEGKRRRI